MNVINHLTCCGQLEIPMGGWFCDDECKKNGVAEQFCGASTAEQKIF